MPRWCEQPRCLFSVFNNTSHFGHKRCHLQHISNTVYGWRRLPSTSSICVQVRQAHSSWRRWSGTPAATTEVAAPIRKLREEKCPNRPALEKILCRNRFTWTSVRRLPSIYINKGLADEPRRERHEQKAKSGHNAVPVAPMKRTLPAPNSQCGAPTPLLWKPLNSTTHTFV